MPRVTTSATSWSGDRRGFPDKTRRLILRRDPFCAECAHNPSEIADHITAHPDAAAAGMSDREYHDPGNGQGMCRPCHDAKTRQQQARGQARRPKRKRPPGKHPGLVN